MQPFVQPSFLALPSGRVARAYRAVALAWQQAFWARRPLSAAVAQRLLLRVDPTAELRRRLPSETHQVFQARFRGSPAVVKFGGVDFDCKFVLRGEVARLRGLCTAGAPVPELLFAAENRARHPFFVARDVGAVPRTAWSADVHRLSWDFEASLIRKFDGFTAQAGLPVMSLEAARESLWRSTSRIESELAEFAMTRPEFLGAVEDVREELDRFTWIQGCAQPPEAIFDGLRFWAIDWDPVGYVPPLKWVCDYTFYEQLRDPRLAWQHATHLVDALGFSFDEAELRGALSRWYRFKALDIGLFFLRKDRRWEHFRLLQRAFFGDVLVDTPTSSTALFRRSYAG